ncbi:MULTISPECIES: hypothetical protein [Flavobacterium]|uniref:Bulb-type lectin domain-containing protein n=1 Tax=Flavobacterium jumunjinense TaxID=998845 RepID=A0ABV5GK18_9FLAO|nr:MULTISPECIES: hypothetical protein [Flavobacterium]
MINNNWIFGGNAGLDFSTSVPTQGNSIDAKEGCASISDTNGTLLFYTDGSKLWDGNHVQRAIGASGLKGNNSSIQSAIIVPYPGNDKQYYVFTADGSSGSNNHFNTF